jgi:FSR family fosmidomycin resistance protein-like MFS transporter
MGMAEAGIVRGEYGMARGRIDMARVGVLAFGHLLLDFDQGVLVILAPVLRQALDTTIGMATALVAAWTLVSSVVQPAVGALCDRRDVRWLVPLGISTAGIGIALAALAPTYGLALLGVVLGGAGTAVFHPEAARRVVHAARRWRATGMSYFSVGGNTGYALGVLAAAPVLILAGRGGIAWLAVLGACYGLLTLIVLGRPGAPSTRNRTGRSREWAWLTPTMGRLVAAVAIRSTVSVGITGFGPLYLQVRRGLPLTADAGVTAAFLLAGVLGTMAGGALADRFGRRRQLLISFAMLPPLGLLFLVLPGWSGYLALVLMGAATLSSFAVTVVIAQELMPSRTGTASGLVLGLGFGIGGLAVGLLGAVADRVGLDATLWMLCLLPVGALALVAGLPETGTLAGRTR